jgi:hypothetical protein
MTTQKNEGEGNHTAARAFNRDQKRFVESGKVEQAAEDAARAVDSGEAKELREAERIGKQHSHGEDPAVSQPKRR